MGGNAFHALLSSSAFPRIPPEIYKSVKQDLLSTISQFYERVDVPREAPEKADHGDVDYIVAGPLPKYGSSVPHQVMKEALKARYVIPMEGNRTSNYAVPVKYGQWTELAHGIEEMKARAATDDGEIYYQIDVHVCSDVAEYDRVMFFHSYGDLGMIIGLLANHCGLNFGVHGLKLPDPPNPPLILSTTFDDIVSFLGLSMHDFEAGFHTRQEVFEWVVLSKYFDPHFFPCNGSVISKVKAGRSMFFEFVEWIKGMGHSSPYPVNFASWKAQVRDEALVYFNKKEEFEVICQERNDRLALKKFFSGSRVRAWANIGYYWKGVKLIMDEIRRQKGGDIGVLHLLKSNGEEGLRRLVIRVRDELGIQEVVHNDSACEREPNDI